MNAEKLWVKIFADKYIERAEANETSLSVEDLVTRVTSELALYPDEEFGLSEREIEAVCREHLELYFLPDHYWAVD